jgi:FdhD protein
LLRQKLALKSFLLINIPESVDSYFQKEVSLTRCSQGVTHAAKDLVASEEPLEIRVRGQGIAITMRTPGHDAELAAGFLVSEGLLHKRSDVIEIAPCQTGENSAAGNIINVFVPPAVKFDLEKLTRHVFASSSCGLCGKASIESVHQHFPPVKSNVQLSNDILCRLPDRLRKGQETFSQTGGLHGSAIFNTNGELIVLREDVGRHNAVDKVVGWAFLNDTLPLNQHILMVSGRASFEIMQKALSANIPIVAAISAPSSLAVEFALESNQTLVGFLRDNSFNIYSHPERII